MTESTSNFGFPSYSYIITFLERRMLVSMNNSFNYEWKPKSNLDPVLTKRVLDFHREVAQALDRSG